MRWLVFVLLLAGCATADLNSEFLRGEYARAFMQNRPASITGPFARGVIVPGMLNHEVWALTNGGRDFWKATVVRTADKTFEEWTYVGGYFVQGDRKRVCGLRLENGVVVAVRECTTGT